MVSFEQLYCLDKKIVKIHRVIVLKLCLILPVRPGDLLLFIITPGFDSIAFRVYELILGRRDRVEDSLLFKLLRIYIQLFADLLHQRLLIITVIYGKMIVIAYTVRISAQYPHACGMESCHPYALRTVSYYLVYTFTHLARCLVRKCNGKDIPRVHAFIVNKPCCTVCKYTRFPGTCPRKDKYRSPGMLNCFLLPVIKAVNNTAHLLIYPSA